MQYHETYEIYEKHEKQTPRTTQDPHQRHKLLLNITGEKHYKTTKMQQTYFIMHIKS